MSYCISTSAMKAKIITTLARQFGVGLDRGVPNLAVLDPAGRVIVAQRGEFEATTKIGPSDVRAFLEKWKPKRAVGRGIAP